MVFDYEPVTLDVESGDSDGVLVFRNKALIAVVAQLSDLHDDHAGWWFVEFVINPRIEAPRQPFPSIEALDTALQQQIA